MFQVRFHGRGGQGVVTAAELLAVAALTEGKHAHAFPSFGSERMSAPVMSFCQIDSEPIRTREPAASSDALIIQDPALLHQAGLLDGLASDGYLLINSAKPVRELGLAELTGTVHRERLLVIPATQLALARLGRPLPGTALLGGFAALTGVVGLAAVEAAIWDRFTGTVGEGNAAAASAAFDLVISQWKALTEAKQIGDSGLTAA